MDMKSVVHENGWPYGTMSPFLTHSPLQFVLKLASSQLPCPLANKPTHSKPLAEVSPPSAPLVGPRDRITTESTTPTKSSPHIGFFQILVRIPHVWEKGGIFGRCVWAWARIAAQFITNYYHNDHWGFFLNVCSDWKPCSLFVVQAVKLLILPYHMHFYDNDHPVFPSTTLSGKKPSLVVSGNLYNRFCEHRFQELWN